MYFYVENQVHANTKNINMYSQNVFLQNVINKNHTDFKVNLKKYLAYAGSWVHF